MHELNEAFMNSVFNQAKKDGYENALNPTEVLVLSTFIVTEFYFGLSRDKAFTSDILDAFHKLAAEWLFNLNLPSIGVNLPDEDVGAMYFQFMTLFYEKTKVRYGEYRSIMQDERGSFRFSERHFSDLGKHLIQSSSSIDSDERKLLTFAFGLAVVEHMSRCLTSLKH